MLATKVFYFFCQSCGGDTAIYDLIGGCPYCHAGRQEFLLVAETTTDSQRLDIQEKLELMRAQWIANHRTASIGEPRRKNRWFRRA
jgi:hypothetical protein